MGLGGVLILALMAGVGVYILLTEKPFSRAKSRDSFNTAGFPKAAIFLERAPQAVEAQAPLWQIEFSKKLQEGGYALMGDYSYVALQFFWTRLFLSPDHKSALMLVNWVEGMEKGRQIITNLEIYSFFSGGDFIVTAASQDGATRLLTGANRPKEEQISLHLKAIFAESAARPLIEEHQKRIAEREARGVVFRELEPANILASLSKVFSA
jgi:hypothetical protein